MFTRILTHGGHTLEFSISDAGADGWEVREAQDHHVVRHARYTDWHRVERALTAFALEVESLEQDGWRLEGITHE
jgi:hypothetical protein